MLYRIWAGNWAARLIRSLIYDSRSLLDTLFYDTIEGRAR